MITGMLLKNIFGILSRALTALYPQGVMRDRLPRVPRTAAKAAAVNSCFISTIVTADHTAKTKRALFLCRSLTVSSLIRFFSVSAGAQRKMV